MLSTIAMLDESLQRALRLCQCSTRVGIATAEQSMCDLPAKSRPSSAMPPLIAASTEGHRSSAAPWAFDVTVRLTLHFEHITPFKSLAMARHRDWSARESNPEPFKVSI